MFVLVFLLEDLLMCSAHAVVEGLSITNTVTLA